MLLGLAIPVGAPAQTTNAVLPPPTLMPIHATVTGVQAPAIMVKAEDGRTLSVVISPATRIEIVSRRSLADLRQGTYVGSGAISEPDGTLRAQ